MIPDSPGNLEILEENLALVHARIGAACERKGRDVDEVLTIVVSKSVGPETIRMLAYLGVGDVGESRVQVASEKARSLSDLGLRWHMIGHLQRNKVKVALDTFALIHSVDSVELAKELDKRAAKLEEPAEVLFEVNFTSEAGRFGFRPEELEAAVRRADSMRHLLLTGLMTMAPIASDPEDVRPLFRRLRELRDELNDKGIYHGAIPHLSMGMSQDFEVAVEEGADMVRIGSAILSGVGRG